MKAYKCYLYGLQILLLAYTAQSFVLLTANMEDIRKLARKFVSESLADKIAEFIVKATEQMSTQMTNMSDEDIAMQDISGDNSNYKLYNIARNREDKPENVTTKKTTQYSSKKEHKMSKTKDKFVEIELPDWRKESREMSIEKTTKKKQKNIHRDSNEILNEKLNKIAEAKKSWQKEKNESKEKLNRMIQSKINDWQKDKYEKTNERYEVDEFKQTQSFNPIIKPDEGRQQYVDLIKPFFSVKDSTNTEYKDLYKQTSKIRSVTSYRPPNTEPRTQFLETSAEEHTTKKTKTHDYKSGSSEEGNDTKLEYETTKFEYPLFKYKALREVSSIAMTTKKEKTDFDQYDNRHYPKAIKEQFVATSGSMMLPKIESKEGINWWDKDSPSSSNVQDDMVHFRGNVEPRIN